MSLVFLGHRISRLMVFKNFIQLSSVVQNHVLLISNHYFQEKGSKHDQNQYDLNNSLRRRSN